VPDTDTDVRGPPPRVRHLATRLGTAAALAATAIGAIVGVRRIGVRPIVHGVLSSNPTLVLVALSLMCLAMAARAVSWRAILSAALPDVRVRLFPVLRATSIGVLVSATVPARVGEPARAVVMARNLGPARAPGALLALVLGTIVSQTILNLAALLTLGALTVATSSVDIRVRSFPAAGAAALLVALLVVVAVGAMARRRRGRLAPRVATALESLRAGFVVFGSWRRAPEAIVTQVAAWALQLLSCYALLAAFGLDKRAGLGAAAGVLFAVNVTAAVPVTPSNLGVFQAACVAVLSGAYGLSSADALAYGIVLQTVEIATAVVMGAPALLREGLGWRELRRRPPALAAEGVAPAAGPRAARDRP
jgi:phosphatidyl-myo-inositol alpha-mannosyltransferase